MDRRDLLLLLGIMALNLLIRLPGLGHSSFDLDEAVHLWNAQKPMADIIARAAGDPNPPLYNILISFWTGLFGVDEVPARWFSLLFSALGAGALFAFLRRGFGLTMALTAVTLFTLSAVQLKFAHNARPYTLMVFCMICSYGMMLEVLRSPARWKYAAYALATALMLYAHPTSVFNLPAQGLFILLSLRTDLWALVKAGAAPVVGFALYLIWYLSIPYFEAENGTWLHPPTWHDALVAIGQLNVTVNPYLPWLQLSIAAAGIAMLIRYRDRELTAPLLLGLLWTLGPFWGNFAFSHMAEPIFQAKYVLSAQVGLTVLMAASIQMLRRTEVRWTVFGIYIASLAHAMDWKVTSGEDWRAATALVKADEGPRTATFISPWYQFQTFAYHYDRDLYRDPAITQPALAERRVFVAWNDIVDPISGRPRFKRIHFIESQGGVFPQGPVLDSLKVHASLVAEHHLEGINLYTFDLRIPTPVTELTFDAQPNGSEVLNGEKQFSEVILYPLDLTYDRDTTLFIHARVRCSGGLEEVFLVSSFIADGEYVAHVQTGAEQALLRSTDWHTIRTEMRYERAKHGAADLKAFVWNPSGKPVEVDELVVSTVRP